MAKAYLNALAEEGTRSDLIHWLVKLDAERDALLAACERMVADLRKMEETGACSRMRISQITDLAAAIAQATSLAEGEG